MTRHDSPRQFDAREEGKGIVATGNERRTPTHDIDDAPTEGSVQPQSKPLQAHPRASASELRPEESDSETSDGVDELRRMEENAEDGRE